MTSLSKKSQLSGLWIYHMIHIRYISILLNYNCCMSVCLSVARVRLFGMLIRVVLETWFQRLYWGNRVSWFRIWYCQRRMVNICCCLRLKSKQISELSQKRGFNGSTGVIMYVDSENDIVNNIWCTCIVKKVISQVSKIRRNFSPA